MKQHDKESDKNKPLLPPTPPSKPMPETNYTKAYQALSSVIQEYKKNSKDSAKVKFIALLDGKLNSVDKMDIPDDAKIKSILTVMTAVAQALVQEKSSRFFGGGPSKLTLHLAGVMQKECFKGVQPNRVDMGAYIATLQGGKQLNVKAHSPKPGKS